jgi:uncharacterized tellurite resistance protein B-like protein
MLSSLLSFLEQRLATPGVTPVQPDALRVAAAALLVEMARADFDEADTELERAREILAERYGLTPEAAAELLRTAQGESDRAVSLFRFTHLINQHLDMPEKIGLMGMLWDVAYADGRLDKHEDALMHKLADLMYVPLAELMAAKDRARKKSRER